jgi:hypothetical protein
MKFDDFLKEYRSHKFSVDDTVVAHFRVATSGLKDGGNTHPFPVVDDKDQMRQVEFESEAIAFHNGTVGVGGDKYSDTMEHIADYLFPLMPLWEDPRVNDKIAEAVLTKNASRWLVCVKDFYWKYGYWYKKDGRLYSNANYEPTVVYGGYANPTYQGGGWKGMNGGINYPLGTAPKPGVDEDYDAIKLPGGLGLPPGNDWGHAFKDGFYGFWKGGKFTTWKKYRSDGRWLPPENTATTISKTIRLETEAKEILGIANSADFLKRYMVEFKTAENKLTMCMNWNRFGRDQQILRIAKKRQEEEQDRIAKQKTASTHGVDPGNIVDATITDNGSLVWGESKKNSKLLNKDLEDMLLCPSCFADDKIDVSPFTLGTHLCLHCGCVFTFNTGYIHLFDPEIKRKFDQSKEVKLIGG